MARNRQKAKERQAKRRAARPAADARPELSESERLRAGVKPVEDVEAGYPDIEQDPHHYDPAEDHPEDADALAPAPRDRPGEPEAAREGARLVQFLRSVVAELRRVQWPDRQALTTMTAVVLGFVLIAGGYLGLLDAIFSRLVKAIL